MIRFPRTLDELRKTQGVVRAGGTDLAMTRRLGLSRGDLLDLRDCEGLDAIRLDGEVLYLGAAARIADVASHPDVIARAPALAKAAGGLATPQIRAMATVAGNLLQRNRCSYLRSGQFSCLKNGGTTCPARAGESLRHACFDLGPCISVHPSTLAVALLLYDAQVESLTGFHAIADLLGDGSDGTLDNRLPADDVILGVYLPLGADERGAYVRAISRAYAEWPIVEVAVRKARVGGADLVRVAVGGVAPVPVRMHRYEQVPLPKIGAEDLVAVVAEGYPKVALAAGAAYKLPVVVAAIEDALERAQESA